MSLERTYTRIRTSDLFKSLLSSLYPTTVGDMVKWADHLRTHHGVYSQAIQRAVRYFMTDFEVLVDDDSSASFKEQCETVLHRAVNLLGEAALVGDDYIGFGNSFSSVHFPFWRSLRCPRCQSSRALKDLGESVKFNGEDFKGKCWVPRCANSKLDTTFEVVDTPKTGPDAKPHIIRWPLQHVTMIAHPTAGAKRIAVDVSKYSWFVDGVRKRDPLFLTETPMEILQAINRSVPLDLDENRVLHLASKSTAYRSAELRGWGQPLFLNEFEDALMVMLLDRFNQLIVSEGVIPFRMVSPAPQRNMGQNRGVMDQMLGVDMGSLRGDFQQLIADHMSNPSGINFFPIPVDYQSFGGDAKQLIPIELLEYSENRLLKSMGIPAEFRGDIPQNSMGPAIGFRMFERFWQHLADGLDIWLTYVQNQLAVLHRWERAQVELVPITLHEDPAMQDLKLQLAAAGEISKKTAWRGLGIGDPFTEKKRRMDEEEREMELLEEQKQRLVRRGENLAAVQTQSPGAVMMMDEQAAMQQQQGAQGAQMPPGAQGAPMLQAGMPMGQTPPGMPVSLDDLMAQAEEIAGQLFQTDTTTKRRQLQELKYSNPTLHNQVQGLMAEMEQAARTQGVQMARAGQMG